ncbi:MAG: ABC transporter permease, partial [Burkholderiales bacterium]
MAGVALGVALGFGVHLVNRAAVEDLAAGVRALSGEADLEVRGGRAGFAETLYPKLARLPGVAAAGPALEIEAGLPGGGAIRLLGIDPLRAGQLQPALFAHQPQVRAQILKPDTVLLSQAAAERLRLGTSGRLALVVGLAT